MWQQQRDALGPWDGLAEEGLVSPAAGKGPELEVVTNKWGKIGTPIHR